jgi:hypothetical protein
MDLSIPAGATDKELSVSWGDPDLSDIKVPFGFYPISKPYNFSPYGLKFQSNKNLRISLKINPASLHQGNSVENVKLLLYQPRGETAGISRKSKVR